MFPLVDIPRLSDHFRGCLLGLAVGDAVGTTVEFRPRGSFTPVTEMTGGGPFRLKPGEWTDDTSMALCLATSLVEIGRVDSNDQMQRYCRWMDSGYLSSNGRCFDIGGTTASALRRYRRSAKPNSGSTDPLSAGNGSIMRLAPIPMFFLPDLDAIERYAAASSITTHGAPECVDACRLFGRILGRALLGQSKESVLFADRATFTSAEKIEAIARGTYQTKSEAAIRGTGYVVESLEAALWCFLRTDTFEHAILTAANLGDDADTTAAICGQVAGAYYGEFGIPSRWIEKLALGSTIVQLAGQLLAKQQRKQEVA
jgi:ADP-ribosyl-[dinitrogen reductase] hydrolase